MTNRYVVPARPTFMSQAATNTSNDSTSQDQNTGESIVSSTADVPGPSWTGVEDVAIPNDETQSIPETDATSSSQNDIRQRRIERFSSQPNNDQNEA